LFTVQVPFSLVLGNVTEADPDTDVFAVKVATAVCVVAPVGLRKFAWMVVTPERSSVAWKLTVTVAGAEETSIEVGVKLNAVRVGGVVSLTDVTDSVLGNPLLVRSAGPRLKVFPTASVMKTALTVHVPASPKRGKVAVAELVTAVAAGKLAEAVWL